MGLGKTIQMLSLIASSLEELKTEAAAEENTLCTHATLIVVPPALVAQWVAEVEKCCGDSLSVSILDVNDKDFLSRDLVGAGGNGNDILVTTYSALDNTKTSRFLANWSWGRIVLDEQQEIRSSTTTIAKNCESLVCHRRWMLSGTPIFEGIEDLRGELNFLHLTPYAAKYEDGFFDFSIMDHWKNHLLSSIETLRILGLLILRRSKDMTICRSGLPIMNQKKLTVELVPIAQSDSERALYCWFEYLVSQEISRKVGEDNNAKHNLQSRDLCE
jgi:SNF2 family DNA or RNA helicase